MSPQHKSDTKVDSKAVGRRLRELRGFDCNQVEFARICGVTQAQLSKYERGKAVPPLEVLLRVKRHFGKGLDWLVTGED